MAATAPIVPGRSFEDFVRAHAQPFAAYLRGILGRQAEGRGGRLGVEDTLQDALLAIYREWPELEDLHEDERNRYMYRSLRDAAGGALRSELGRRDAVTTKPKTVSLDGALLAIDDGAPARHREEAAALLGKMAADLAAVREAEAVRVDRLTLNRAVLASGLRALSERETVILIAVDHLDWDQHQLAAKLGMEPGHLRVELAAARKLFYTVVRHAVGVEVDDEERADLHAYLRGELKGAKARAVRRHRDACAECQALERELRVFNREALAVLSPLPFFLGGQWLAKQSTVKAAAVGGGAGTGLFAQPGAAKASMAVLGLLTFGFGGTAVLAQLDQDHRSRGPAASNVAAPRGPSSQPPFGGMRRVVASASASASASGTTSKTTKSSAKVRHHKRASTSGSRQSAASHANATPQRQTTTQSTPPASSNTNNTSSTSKSTKQSAGSGCEFFCG